MEVYCLYIKDKIDRNLLEIYKKYINKDKTQRINRKYNIKDAQNSILADILLRCVLYSNYNEDIYNNGIEYNIYGKPFIKNKSIFFNISHSEDFIVIAIDTMPIGIDIEKIQKIDISISKFYFKKEESEFIYSFRENERLERFYEVWTLKESFVKNLGIGLQVDLDSFSVCNKGEIKRDLNYGQETYYLLGCTIKHNYRLSVCSKKIYDNLKLRFCDISYINNGIEKYFKA